MPRRDKTGPTGAAKAQGGFLRNLFSKTPHARTSPPTTPFQDPQLPAGVIDTTAPLGNETLDELTSQFRMAMTALKTLDCDGDEPSSENTVHLPLHFVLSLLPEHYIVASELDTVPLLDPTEVCIQDLFSQLAAGQIITNVAALARGLPPKLVNAAAYSDNDTAIVVPLPQVVQCMQPGALVRHTAKEDERYPIDNLPNLFTEIDRDHAAPDETTDGTQTADTSADADDKGVGKVVFDVIRQTRVSSGVDLNNATAEKILTIPDVSVGVANSILEYRRQHGSFENIFELTLVPGLNRKDFHSLTGMPLNRHRRDRAQVLANLLNLPIEGTTHLPTIARALGQHDGLYGAMISNDKGNLLAQYGISADSDALASVVPRMFQQIQDNMHKILVPEVRSASIGVDGKMFSIITSGHVFVTVIQHASRMTKDLQKLVARTARELEWLLSHRGYIASKRLPNLDAQKVEEETACKTLIKSETF